MTDDDDDDEIECMPFTNRCPNLQSMTLYGRNYREELEAPNDFLLNILSPLKQLTYLDLSYWQRVEDLRCLHPVSLTVLILYDVPDLYRALDTICQLTQLRFCIVFVIYKFI
jgi:hypothetical protein